MTSTARTPCATGLPRRSSATDASFDPQNPTQIKIGRRLAIKLLNAAKFTLSFDASGAGTVTEPLDRSMLATLAGVVTDATRAFESYDHQRALEITESFFWTFCDDFLELVKERAHNGTGQDQASAVTAPARGAVDVRPAVRALPPLRD